MKHHNANPDEINKFDALADDWWDPNGPMKPLHQINPIRSAFIHEHAPLNNMRVLDVGCGAGLLSEAMHALGAKVTGIDLSEQAITMAKAHAESQAINIDYRVAAIEDIEESFDIITCMEMIEHVPEPEKIISDCATLLVPQGRLFLSTLNRNIKSYLMSIVGAEYVLRMLPIGTHDYHQFIKPSELARMCRHANLQHVAMKGISYSALKSTFSLSDDVSVNYMACYRKRDA